ncbi:MAG: hypothetical protein JWQ72_1673 [Polaromonas sp.]|nr:hypothetical protein [Polaromonas sp.]
MSARCSAAVYERYPAGGGEFALALALADNAHEDGTHIFPSVDTMALKSRQSVRSVQRSLRRMQEIGWLVVVRNGRGGRGKSVEYRINPEWLKGADLSPFIEPPELSVKGAKHGIKRVPNEALKGDIHDITYITSRTSKESPLPPKGGEREQAMPESGDRGQAGAGSGGGAEADGFDRVLELFPRKDHSLRARKQWDALAPNAALQTTIMEAVKAWTRSPRWQADNGRYIPKLSTWLRNELWRDAPGVAVAVPNPAKPAGPTRPAAPMPASVIALRARVGLKPLRSAVAAGA